MAAEEKSQSSWSAIPLDLAGMVLRLLPGYAYRSCFAAVCPQWRCAVRQQQQQLLVPRPVPLLALPDGTFYSLPEGKHHRFPGCGFGGYESVCGSCLVFTRDDGCFLVDPFSRDTVTLPALSCVRLRPPSAAAKRTAEVPYAAGKWSEEERTRFAYPYVTWMHICDSDKLHISKIVLCTPNLAAALVGNGHVSQILMCRPGALSWSVRAYDKCRRFQDMSFYQGKLYILTCDEDLLVVNIGQDLSTGDPQVSRIGRVIKSDPRLSVLFVDNLMICKKHYLVESCGILLMVRRKIWCQLPERGVDKTVARKNEFEVFKADFEHSRWINVTMTMGDDQVLFLGRRCSRAMSMSQYGMPGGQIFFLDDDEKNRVEYDYAEKNTSISVYDMRSGVVLHPRISWKRSDEMCLASWLFPQD